MQQSKCKILTLHVGLESHGGVNCVRGLSSSWDFSDHGCLWYWDGWEMSPGKTGYPSADFWKRSLSNDYIFESVVRLSQFLKCPQSICFYFLVKSGWLIFSTISLVGNHILFATTTSFQNPSALLFGPMFCHQSGQRQSAATMPWHGQQAPCPEISFEIWMS